MVGSFKKRGRRKVLQLQAISVEFEGRDPEIRSQGVAALKLKNSRGNTEENRRARKSELAVFAVKKKGKKSNKKHVQTLGDHAL